MDDNKFGMGLFCRVAVRRAAPLIAYPRPSFSARPFSQTGATDHLIDIEGLRRCAETRAMLPKVDETALRVDRFARLQEQVVLSKLDGILLCDAVNGAMR